jgi:hypothetical protein
MEKNKNIKKPKDKEIEFIVGVSQGETAGELKIEDARNNFVYQQYLESRNWHEYYDSIKLHKSIDTYIKESKYKHIYESFDKIKFEDAINIYFHIKERVKKEQLIESNIYVFVTIMYILSVNVTLAFSYVPLDEKYLFNQELENKKLITKANENKNMQLF